MRGLLILVKWCGLFLAGLSVVPHAYTQTICGFDHLNTSLKKDFPAITKSIIGNEVALRKIILERSKQLKREKKELVIYTIPIVVHVLHTGESIGTRYNPADAAIIEAIDYLNEVYSGKSSFLTPPGEDAAGDIGIRFVLAKRDPDCNPTNGIDRIDMSGNAEYVVNGVNYQDVVADINLKASIIWDKSLYYNIYIVNKINGQDGFEVPYVAGYAYLPNSSVIDGAVILSSQMKVGSTTLVHEMGHAFNLYHPFEGSNVKDECPVGEGDMVDDTDPISRNTSSDGTVDFTCRTGANPCNNHQMYNIRTENNFMNYTACNTLFTPGQKERMLASLLLDDRKTLLTSTALLSTYQFPACEPKINFEKGYTTFERISKYLTSNCRKYKDYTINFTISSSPLKNTTVSLFIDTGTNAIENVDFDFPSGKVIVFPSGKHDTLSLNIRVFNDEDYKEERILNVGFTIDDSTDALKGSAVKTMRIALLPKDAKPLPPGATIRRQIGTYDINITGTQIFNGEVTSQNTRILYRAGELKSAGIDSGKIAGLSFFLQKHTSKSFMAVYIKMGHTPYNELVKDGEINTSGNLETVAGLTSYSTVQGWNYFKFNNPFIWNGIDNIVVEFCIDNKASAGFGVDDIHAFADTGSVDRGNTIFSTGEGCEPNFTSVSYYSRGIRPVIQFEYAKPSNAVADTISVSATGYIGPYAEVYFYDKSFPGKIIGKIKNLTSWNYGCTNINIDRCGDKVAPFLNNVPSQFLAQKTYFITPERNNPNGKYEITLYYTLTEKNGYEQGTGVQWRDIKMIKAHAPVNSITPQTPPPGNIEAVQLYKINNYGDAYALTARFNTGFSAYGIGVIGDAVLPVEWLNLQALIVNREDVLLQWQTASEINNNYFEVEKSADAVNFTVVGRIYSKGNSNTISSYEFLHRNPVAAGKIYYRLKQVDNDGTFNYSGTINVSFDNNGTNPSVYPVPASGYININFGKPALNPVVEIFSSDMKLVGISKKMTRSASERINIQHLTPGNYIIRLSFEGKKYALRFVKL
ncbi:MAG: M43 family zinc metalloprotease [Agriterribacter sp.]